MPKHLILVGACYIDTLLSVPFFPSEDSKLRATSSTTRIGGNCPNSLQVLQQLVTPSDDLAVHLISCLPSRSSPASRRIARSLTGELRRPNDSSTASARGNAANLEHCIYREDQTEPASSYIMRSDDTGSRTIVNYNNLPEMTVPEFQERVQSFDPTQETWWHFEGRIPPVTLACMHLLRTLLPGAMISVEIEKPGREGLKDLAAQADVVFYSRAWAESSGYESPEACLKGEWSQRPFLSLCSWGADGATSMSHSSQECVRFPIKQTVAVVE
ncbi:hypothetical protein NLU13_1893 [Sarocladium strictum]|uniref:Carbohydrate kinase PfkB domain-containing protein n=1 Tax=Sarocladium strictum TaxID=5046 RepID=A0AA39GTD5_SARSR|nr:hypothetical protein NLU13_1893 [Sarocladium strictum]